MRLFHMNGQSTFIRYKFYAQTQSIRNIIVEATAVLYATPSGLPGIELQTSVQKIRQLTLSIGILWFSDNRGFSFIEKAGLGLTVCEKKKKIGRVGRISIQSVSICCTDVLMLLYLFYFSVFFSFCISVAAHKL